MSEYGTRRWDYIPAEDHVRLRLCCGPHSRLVLRTPVCGVSADREGTNVLDVRVWGVGGVLFVVTFERV